MNLKDPTVLAETELLNAAAAIEAAAKKLADLRPRPELVMHFTVAFYYDYYNNCRKLMRT